MTDFTPETPVLTPIRDHAAELAKAEAGVAEMAAKRNNRWYPKYHIASNGGWINDPNGLCFYKGRWHVFYQLHPYGTQWGPMHWGHVSSTDMLNWKREPIMFAPSLEQEKDGVFSGSAVIDDNGDLRFYYTGHRWANGHDNTGGDWQVQMTALPDNDELTSATKQGMIIDCPTDKVDHHYRDPKVWKTGDIWYMTSVSPLRTSAARCGCSPPRTWSAGNTSACSSSTRIRMCSCSNAPTSSPSKTRTATRSGSLASPPWGPSPAAS